MQPKLDEYLDKSAKEFQKFMESTNLQHASWNIKKEIKQLNAGIDSVKARFAEQALEIYLKQQAKAKKIELKVKLEQQMNTLEDSFIDNALNCIAVFVHQIRIEMIDICEKSLKISTSKARPAIELICKDTCGKGKKYLKDKLLEEYFTRRLTKGINCRDNGKERDWTLMTEETLGKFEQNF